MICEVKLYVAGKVFVEKVHARDYQDARQVALARNPNAKVLGVTAVFGRVSFSNPTSIDQVFLIQHQEILKVM